MKQKGHSDLQLLAAPTARRVCSRATCNAGLRCCGQCLGQCSLSYRPEHEEVQREEAKGDDGTNPRQQPTTSKETERTSFMIDATSWVYKIMRRWLRVGFPTHTLGEPRCRPPKVRTRGAQCRLTPWRKPGFRDIGGRSRLH